MKRNHPDSIARVNTEDNKALENLRLSGSQSKFNSLSQRNLDDSEAKRHTKIHKIEIEYAKEDVEALKTDWGSFMLDGTTFEDFDTFTLCRGREVISKTMVEVHLTEEWAYSSPSHDILVKIIGAEKSGENIFKISDTKGLMIIDPYLLIAPTTISGMHSCERKSVIKNFFATQVGSSLPLLIGNSMHELFQYLLMNMSGTISESLPYVTAMFRSKVLPNYFETLALLNLSIPGFMQQVTPYIKVIYEWFKNYMPKPYGEGKELKIAKGAKLLEVLDIEESIHLPELGLKGKIDATIKVIDDKGKEHLSALELKTGKTDSNVAHVTQANMYAMMLKELTKQDIFPSQLLYLKNGSTKVTKPDEYIQGVIIRWRNELARFMKLGDDIILPEILSDPNLCSYCEVSQVCAIQNRFESKKEDKSEEGNAYKKTSDYLNLKLSTVTDQDLAYFQRWKSLVLMEWSEATKQGGISTLLTLTPEERFAKKTCLNNVKLVAFKLVDNGSELTLETSVFDTEIRRKWTQNSYVYVSSLTKAAVCSGSIIVADANITIKCRSTLNRSLIIGEEYHIDMVESNTFFQNNLMGIGKLMEGTESAKKLRSVIIQDTYSEPVVVEEKASLKAVDHLNTLQKEAVELSFKCEQYHLIRGLPGAGKTTVIAALINRYVAAGKNVLLVCYTNSAVDNCLEKVKKRNGVNDYVIEDDDIVRLGQVNSAKFGKAYCITQKISRQISNERKVSEARRIYEKSKLVLSTTSTVPTHMLFGVHKIFDVCIVDEASLCIEANLLMPLLNANSFVLVGDERQLQPLVQSEVAEKMGMNVSLFERLVKRGKGLTSLNHQFRMNREICKLPSKHFYKMEMICANEDVENAVIKCKRWEKKECDSKLHPKLCMKLLSHEMCDSLLFVNWDSSQSSVDHSPDLKKENILKDELVKAEIDLKVKEEIDLKVKKEIDLKVKEEIDSSVKDEIPCVRMTKTIGRANQINKGEADACVEMVKLYIKSDVRFADMAIITPFREQVSLIHAKIVAIPYVDCELEDSSKVEVSTIDQFQGRDKSIIIFSTVFNSKFSPTCKLVENPRRLNVALTRAKHKLIIIGSLDCLKKLTLFGKVLEDVTNVINYKTIY
uniref:DNA replication ATP-dependent helicase/nuclease n=1 Tax=Rhabditophanes sp. KR3021 TaxID=114890 RepID=A0AC35TYJ9_9BILA